MSKLPPSELQRKSEPFTPVQQQMGAVVLSKHASGHWG